MTDFELHSQLATDCELVTDLTLCRVLLMRDANYPWVILVPKVADVREMHQLSDADQQQLIKEISFVSEKMDIIFQADKINIGALGNMVPQLHIHVIARFTSDLAWPNPVWGYVPSVAYENIKLQQTVKKIQEALL